MSVSSSLCWRSSIDRCYIIICDEKLDIVKSFFKLRGREIPLSLWGISLLKEGFSVVVSSVFSVILYSNSIINVNNKTINKANEKNYCSRWGGYVFTYGKCPVLGRGKCGFFPI